MSKDNNLGNYCIFSNIAKKGMCIYSSRYYKFFFKNYYALDYFIKLNPHQFRSHGKNEENIIITSATKHDSTNNDNIFLNFL